MKNVIIFFFLFLHYLASAQNISVFAGNGNNVFSGDNGPATAAGVSDPGCGGVFDKYGNYFINVLQNENRVRKIDTNGIITTVAGGGHGGDGSPATAAALYNPIQATLDSFGNIYICEAGRYIVRKVDALTGIISTVAGTLGFGGSSGDGGQATAATLRGPQYVCFDKHNNMYISDLYNYKVRKVNTFGIITTFAGIGTLGSSGDFGMATAAQLDFPTGLVADDSGNIYIADPGSLANRVRKVSASGVITTFAGNGSASYTGDEIPATNASISPCWLAIDSFNNIYIADKYNRRVYKVDGSGIIHCIAGNGLAGFGGMGGPATNAPLDYPAGVSLDACGNIYIPLADSNRIVKITFDSSCDPYHSGGPLVTKNLQAERTDVFPNPAATTINITGSINALTITNLIGQTVYQQQYHSSKAEVDISHLQPGVYMVAITDEEGRRTVKKIVKE